VIEGAKTERKEKAPLKRGLVTTFDRANVLRRCDEAMTYRRGLRRWSRRIYTQVREYAMPLGERGLTS
jgi:hypothetical protein